MGREWPRVLIADASACSKDDPTDGTEAHLVYVAVTRTRQRLGLGGLSWIPEPP
ncbi:ATP-binding domain-containing protein [Streptomyces sp. NPDC004262]